MIEKLTQLMVQSGADWVLWLMFGLSVVSMGVAVDRWLILRKAGSDVPALVVSLRRLLRARDLKGAEKLLTQTPGVAAAVVHTGLLQADLGSESAQEAMNAALGLERARLEERLLILGTVGNNAPFVGLLGTVIGVVGAFEELGKPAAMSASLQGASALAPERVMGTIAEALVATAVGLVVAIPAVAAFNALQNRVNQALAGAETLGHVLLAHLTGGIGRSAPPPPLEAEDAVLVRGFGAQPAE
jgi:biopolymer transport protein ExbB